MSTNIKPSEETNGIIKTLKKIASYFWSLNIEVGHFFPCLAGNQIERTIKKIYKIKKIKSHIRHILQIKYLDGF